MKLKLAVGFTGLAIYAISLYVIWKSYNALNDSEKEIADSIERKLGKKAIRTFLLSLLVLKALLMFSNINPQYVYCTFFLFWILIHSYQYKQLKSVVTGSDLPDSIILIVLNSHIFLVVGLIFIFMSFL